MPVCSSRLGVQGEHGVIPLKLMARHPRGTSVKAHHGMPSLKGVQFAEQLQVTPPVTSLSSGDLAVPPLHQ